MRSTATHDDLWAKHAVRVVESFRLAPGTCWPSLSGDQFHLWLVDYGFAAMLRRRARHVLASVGAAERTVHPGHRLRVERRWGLVARAGVDAATGAAAWPRSTAHSVAGPRATDALARFERLARSVHGPRALCGRVAKVARPDFVGEGAHKWGSRVLGRGCRRVDLDHAGDARSRRKSDPAARADARDR
jgi:hypothetical protein